MKRRYKWHIRTGTKQRISNYYYLGEDFTDVGSFEIKYDNKKPLTFDKKKEAREFMESLIEEARQYARQLDEEILQLDTADEIWDAHDAIIKKLENGISQEKSEYCMYLMNDIISNDLIFEGIYEPKEYAYKIVKKMVREGATNE